MFGELHCHCVTHLFNLFILKHIQLSSQAYVPKTILVSVLLIKIILKVIATEIESNANHFDSLMIINLICVVRYTNLTNIYLNKKVNREFKMFCFVIERVLHY